MSIKGPNLVGWSYQDPVITDPETAGFQAGEGNGRLLWNGSSAIPHPSFYRFTLHLMLHSWGNIYMHLHTRMYVHMLYM